MRWNNNGRKVSVPTVENYLKALLDAFLLHRVGRYDIKEKQALSIGCKYYVADIGLRDYLLGNAKADEGKNLENVVYLELRRRGYQVKIGKIGQEEVSFVASKNGEIAYYQVVDAGHDEEILSKKKKVLESIRDHYPKFLLSIDVSLDVSNNGIKQQNVWEWLLEKM